MSKKKDKVQSIDESIDKIKKNFAFNHHVLGKQSAIIGKQTKEIVKLKKQLKECKCKEET